jgi:hypothetical protein
MFKIPKDKKDFFHKCRHDLETKGKQEKMMKISLMEVCSNCYGHKNNQVYMIFEPRQEQK